MSIQAIPGSLGFISLVRAQAPLWPAAEAGARRTTSPAFSVTISDSSRTAASRGRLLFGVSELEQRHSERKALTKVDAALRQMRSRAKLVDDPALSVADRVTFGDELIDLKSDIDEVAASDLSDQKVLPSFSRSAAPSGSARLRVASDTEQVTSVSIGAAEAGATFTLTAGGGLTLTNTSTRESETLNVNDITVGKGHNVAKFDSMGVAIAFSDALAADPQKLAAALNGGIVSVAAGGEGSDADLTVDASTTRGDALIALIDAAIADVGGQRAAADAEIARVERDLKRPGADPNQRLDPAELSAQVFGVVQLLGKAHRGLNTATVGRLLDS